MKCPHCLVQFHDEPLWVFLGQDSDDSWAITKRMCPACGRMILRLLSGDVPVPNVAKIQIGVQLVGTLRTQVLVRPRGANRPPCPDEVRSESPNIAEDYEEACLVFADSAKASAALSRRCLQHLLREKGGVKPSNLFDEIGEALASKQLPSHLTESLDAVRNIGNFAAHATKSTSTGEILPVEEGEAEWNLDVLEGLFDHYYVQPAITAKKKAALNKKLADAGKTPMQ